MTKYDRLKALIRYMIKEAHLADSQAQLGERMGYVNASYFSQILNGKVAMPREFISGLKELVPDVSLDWLESGRGDMLIGNQVGKVEQHDNAQFAQGDITNNASTSEYIAIIKKQQEQIDKLIEIISKGNGE